MWITQQDVINGIVRLMKNGKKLPNADIITAIKSQNLSPADMQKAVKTETQRQIRALAAEWLDILVPAEQYRTKDDKEMDIDRWNLAIKETLKVRDYHKVLDMSVLSEGIERADEIIAKAKAEVAKEAQDKANAEWKKLSDEMSESQKYKSAILAHWTALRTKAGLLSFGYPSTTFQNVPEHQRNANRRMLYSWGERNFPECPKEVLEDNLILFGMQTVNYRHCEHDCQGYQDCYMQAHRLGLEYSPTSKKFYVTNNSAICPKFVAAKARAKAEEQARIAKIAAMEEQLRAEEGV